MESTPDGLIELATELLRASDHAWSTVSGTLNSLYEEDVLYPDVAGSSVSEGFQFGRLQGSYRFWATASPWQMRLETVKQIVPPGRVDAMMPDVLITDRRTWQARRKQHVSGGRWPPDTVITDLEGKRWVVFDHEVLPDPGHRYSSHGLENLDLLLKPAPLVRAFHFDRATQVNHESRSSIQVRATPVQGDDFYSSANGLVAIGADPYVLTLDSEYGIVLDVTITIGGQIGRRHTLSGLRFEEPMDQQLFSQSALNVDCTRDELFPPC